MPMPPFRTSWIRSSTEGFTLRRLSFVPLGLRPREPSVDTLPNDAPLELGEHAKHLKHRLARPWSRHQDLAGAGTDPRPCRTSPARCSADRLATGPDDPPTRRRPYRTL